MEQQFGRHPRPLNSVQNNSIVDTVTVIGRHEQHKLGLEHHKRFITTRAPLYNHFQTSGAATVGVVGVRTPPEIQVGVSNTPKS